MRSSSSICGARVMCGVSERKMSLRSFVVFVSPKSGPMRGRSERNGRPVFVRIFEVWMRPARKLVSPSFSRMFDVIVRVAMIGCF